jgi:hypothetical protein
MAHLMSNGESAIKVAPGSELEQAIAGATNVSEIQALLHAAAVDQKLVQPDPFDRDGKDYFRYKPVTPGTAAAAKGFAKTLLIDGTKHIVEGATESELQSNELALMRSLFSTPAATGQVRDASGRFVAQPSQAELAAEAEAERLVNINPTAAALAPSVKAYLESEGVSVADLKEFSQSKRNIAAESDWRQATETFRNSVGSDWVGGSQNLQKITELLHSNPQLLESGDKVSALMACWEHMKENDLVVPNPEVEKEKAISESMTYEELKSRVGYRDIQVNVGSGFWGR